MPKERAGRVGKQADKPTYRIELLFSELQELISLRGVESLKATERNQSYFFEK